MRSFRITRLLQLVDRILKLLVPVVRRRVCYLSIPDYGDSAYYLYRHLLQTRSRLEHVWLVNDVAFATRIRSEFQVAMGGNMAARHSLHVVRKASLRGYFLYLGSRWVFYTHGLYGFSDWAPGRCVVCLWHGMPLKCIGSLDVDHPSAYRPFGTLHVATSHLFRYIVACAFEVRPEAVRIVGLPRCDALRFDDARGHTRQQVRAIMGIPEDHRLVLWLPTFRTRLRDGAGTSAPPVSFVDDLSPSILAALQRHAAPQRCRILVKLHPQDRLNHAAVVFGQSGIEVLRSQDWLQYGIQLYDLIAASDALISDVSSVIVDYLVTMRPLGILGFDENTYDRDLVVPMNLLLKSERIRHLCDEPSMAAFFATVGTPVTQSGDAHDCSALLYEPLDGKSAERVAQEAGL